MNTELEPCPFCGDQDAEVAESSVPTIAGGKKQAVYCTGCFCEGPTADTHAEAIAAWNRRAAQPVSAGLTDEQIDMRVRTACHSDPTMASGEYCLTIDEVRALLSAAQRDSQPVADTSADARDAARYRWLRDSAMPDDVFELLERVEGDDLDVEIDAAIAASREGKC